VRKKVGIALLALGAFVLVLAGVAKFYAYDRLAVAPLDRNASTAEGAEDNPTVAEGEGTIFSLAEGFQEIQTTVTSTRNTVGQVDESEEVGDSTDDDIVIYETFSYTTDGEDRVLSGTFDRVPFDRHTGETYDCPEDVADLCDEKTGSVVPETVIERLIDRFGTDDLTQIAGDEGDIAFLRPGDEGFDGFEGQYFKMPFNTQKQNYPWWDGSIRQATDMVFQDEEEVQGLTTYRFQQVIPPTDIADQELPASVTGLPDDVLADRMYSNTRTVWIEPETGAIIKASEDQLTTFDYEGEQLITATDVTIEYNEETQEAFADEFGPLATQLKIIRVWVPWAGLIVGIVLLAVGGFLIYTSRKREARRSV
jgi:hypothetical protein